MSPSIDETHDPARTSWVASAEGHPNFPIQNLPLGVFSPPRGEPRVGTAIGDEILDLKAVAEVGLLAPATAATLSGSSLNAFLALPAAERTAVRRALSALLSDPAEEARLRPHLYPASTSTLHLPARIGDYTDFYVGIHHAVNVGKLFRPDNPLLPNYKHIPIGYHGRSSSVRISDEPVVRPKGQTSPPGTAAPAYGPSRRLDYELELGLWIGPGNVLGETIPVDRAWEHIAGFCLLNDWSARDLQAWEYQPLGPFLAKNFHTTISPWIVTAEAMAPFRIPQPPRPEGDPEPLGYLSDPLGREAGALSVELEVLIRTARMREAGEPPHRLSRGAASAMYWTVAQILAHHASNGCNLNPGDLLGTGTLSTAEREGWGSLMEISRGGTEPASLPNGETRTFLEDGDEVIFEARARAEGRAPIGFGSCRAVISAAK